MYKTGKRGFTLLELLIVIAILGVLSSLITGSFITSLQKGRDAKRKSDLENIQKAIEMYYEDNRQYPPALVCRQSFSGPTEVYMQMVPCDPKADYDYEYSTAVDGSWFKLYSCIENANDAGPGVKQGGEYGGTCCLNNSACKYGISSPNTSP